MDRNTQESTGDLVLFTVQSSAPLFQNTLSLTGENIDTPIFSVIEEFMVRYSIHENNLKEFRPAMIAI